MRISVILVLLLAAACSASDAGREPAVRIAGPPLLARELIARRVAAIGNDSFPLFQPMRVRVLGDTLVVSDMGDDRIVLFSADLDLLHTFGRSGSGPGEFQGPFHLEAWNGLIAVGDMTNQRVSFFRPDGRLVREVPLHQSLRDFIVGADGSVYHIATNGYDTYFTAIAPDDTRRAWGTRPPALRPDTASGKGYVGLGGIVAVRTPDQSTHVLDNNEGVLVRLDSAGAVQSTVSLPASLLGPIRERIDETIGAFARQGTRVISAPLTKDFTSTADGRLLVVLSSRDVVGLVIDPETYDAREIRVPSADGPWDAARRASSMALRDGVLYAVTEEGLYAFALEEARER